jgi:hypothetical protein
MGGEEFRTSEEIGSADRVMTPAFGFAPLLRKKERSASLFLWTTVLRIALIRNVVGGRIYGLRAYGSIVVPSWSIGSLMSQPWSMKAWNACLDWQLLRAFMSVFAPFARSHLMTSILSFVHAPYSPYCNDPSLVLRPFASCWSLFSALAGSRLRDLQASRKAWRLGSSGLERVVQYSSTIAQSIYAIKSPVQYCFGVANIQTVRLRCTIEVLYATKYRAIFSSSKGCFWIS